MHPVMYYLMTYMFRSLWIPLTVVCLPLFLVGAHAALLHCFCLHADSCRPKFVVVVVFQREVNLYNFLFICIYYLHLYFTLKRISQEGVGINVHICNRSSVFVNVIVNICVHVSGRCYNMILHFHHFHCVFVLFKDASPVSCYTSILSQTSPFTLLLQ